MKWLNKKKLKKNEMVQQITVNTNEIYQLDFLKVVACRFSSRPEVFCKTGVLRNFAKFTIKHLPQSLFSNKVAGWDCNFIKKKLRHRCFPVNFAKFLRKLFFSENISGGCFQIDAFRRASHHCITKKVSKTEIVRSTHIVQIKTEIVQSMQIVQSAAKIYWWNFFKVVV